MKHTLITFLFVLCLAPSSLLAQGFDCNKAQTPVERLICATPEIASLDKELNVAVQTRLATAPQQRSNFLEDSQKWLRSRDKSCFIPNGNLSKQQLGVAISCLTKVYRMRLDVIAALPAPTNDASKPLCNRFIETYRTTITTRLNDPKDDNAPLNQRPYTLLANTPNSGITRAQAGETLIKVNASKLSRWALRQRPPILLSPQVKKDILDLSDVEDTTIDHAPATNYYVANQIGGSADCISGVSFVIKDGIAERVSTPLWSYEQMDSCGVDQFFGVINGQTVAVEDNVGFNYPDLTRIVNIKAWNGTDFSSTCTVSFDYDPVFFDGTSVSQQDEDQKCLSHVCNTLKPTALELVKTIQHAPLVARQEAINRLSTDQRATFNIMERLAIKRNNDVSVVASAPEAPEDPSHYTDQAPLLLPVVNQGELFLASVGQFTIGWRTFPDWTVKFEKLVKGELQLLGVPYVAMRRGALRAANVR